ncbi:MAG TPA: diguanylate cyclase [Burkholderiales bacterium]
MAPVALGGHLVPLALARPDPGGILNVEERPARQLGPFLMAAGSSLLACVALFVCAFLDLLEWQVAVEGVAIIAAISVVFFAIFRSGLNERFEDRSLAVWQVGVAILFLAYILYRAGPAREGLILLYPLALLFGVLRLPAKRLMALAVLALAAHGVVLHLSYLNDDFGDFDLDNAIAEFAVLMIVLPWFAVMGGYVNRMRLKLAETNRELSTALERIEQLAIRDELTGGYNRRYMMDVLARERSRAERLREPFSICLLDIDHFKSVNDALGHGGGDAVLHELPSVARQGLRGVDVFGRFGGEEFLLVLPGTELEGAALVAERVRAAVEAAQFPGLPSGRRVTVTLGVAERAAGEDIKTLLKRADRALYAGKGAGRNRVEVDAVPKG